MSTDMVGLVATAMLCPLAGMKQPISVRKHQLSASTNKYCWFAILASLLTFGMSFKLCNTSQFNFTLEQFEYILKSNPVPWKRLGLVGKVAQDHTLNKFHTHDLLIFTDKIILVFTSSEFLKLLSGEQRMKRDVTNHSKLKCLEVVKTSPTKFLSDLLFEKFHFGGLAVNQDDVLRLTLADQLHDTLGVRMGAENRERDGDTCEIVDS